MGAGQVNTLVVIQARLGSTRLPGKILMDLGGKAVLRHVVERAQRAGYNVVMASPWRDIGRLLPRFGCSILFPPQSIDDSDVLGRFASAANNDPDADIIVRLTADCPCLDPQLIQQAVAAIEAGHDYAGNTVERHWPRGLDVEAFTTELLQRAHEQATDPYDREHVTPWMQRWASNPYALPAPEPDRALERYRWCLDTPQDYSWLSGAVNALGDPTTAALAEYSRLYPPPLD